jgi:hypothetical protein
MKTDVARAGIWVVALLALSGCATAGHRAGLRGVPIEQRPTPPQPPPDSTLAQREVPEPTPTTPPAPAATPSAREPAPTPTPPVQTVMSAEDRRASLERIVADTTAAGAAVRRCDGKTLLPDQESVYETTRSYLTQARAAITRGELWSAEGLARKARQLALSLECK